MCDMPGMLASRLGGEAKTDLTLVTCLIEEARTSAPAKPFADCIYLL